MNKQKFEQDYWDKYYSDAEDMDGVGNAKVHAEYAKSLFDLERVKINSILDLGFGQGRMLMSFINAFKPYRVEGVEISKHMFGKSEIFPFLENNKTLINKSKFYNMDIVKWSGLNKKSKKVFDLTILNSVAQYIDDEDLQFVMEILSKMSKYLYLTAPTNKELDIQIKHFDFHDKIAIRRSKSKYKEIISPYFKIVGNRVLESKFHFNDQNSNFSELLFKHW